MSVTPPQIELAQAQRLVACGAARARAGLREALIRELWFAQTMSARGACVKVSARGAWRTRARDG